jgi:two-component system, response regulator FlrC
MKREFVTGDRVLGDLLSLAETVSPSRAVILISGESGSGKRTLARWIHDRSQRSNQLFGILQGSETGTEDLRRAFEKVRGGTLYMSEVAALTSDAQEYMLNHLQTAVLDQQSPRIILSTKLNLSELVQGGKFKAALYERIATLHFKIPALRERIGDIEILANAFLKRQSQKSGRETMTFSDESLLLLNSHQWPGNVRELEAVIERSMIIAKGSEIQSREIQMHTVGMSAQQKRTMQTIALENWKPGRTLNDIERTVILEALEYHMGNRTHTAKSLGISIRTLRNKLAEYRVLGIKV